MRGQWCTRGCISRLRSSSSLALTGIGRLTGAACFDGEADNAGSSSATGARSKEVDSTDTAVLSSTHLGGSHPRLNNITPIARLVPTYQNKRSTKH